MSLEHARLSGRVVRTVVHDAHFRAWARRYDSHVRAWQARLARRSKDEWRSRLDTCSSATAEASREWDHGVPTDADYAHSAYTVFELGGESSTFGGQAGWLSGTEGAIHADLPETAVETIGAKHPLGLGSADELVDQIGRFGTAGGPMLGSLEDA